MCLYLCGVCVCVRESGVCTKESESYSVFTKSEKRTASKRAKHQSLLLFYELINRNQQLAGILEHITFFPFSSISRQNKQHSDRKISQTTRNNLLNISIKL